MQQGEGQRIHALLIYRAMIPSIRLCGHCQMEYLAREGKLEYRAIQEMKLTSDDLNWADVVLLGRLDSWYEHQLTRMLRDAGKYLIYIIDDDLLNIPPEISSAAYYGQRSIQRYIREMIEMSHAILSPSPLLLEKYAIDGRRAIQIEEPAINPIPYRAHDPDKPVKIGFAGSIDRTGDIEGILKDALIQIKREYGERVQFEFFGAIPTFARALEGRCIPYQGSYDAYRAELNGLGWDIGLAPIPETPFHACKHYNKFIEYAAAGIMGIFSETAPYTRLRSLGAPGGFCPNDAAAWYETICFYIKHSVEREEARRDCVQMAHTRFSVARSAAELMDAVKDIFNQGREKKSVAGLLFVRIRGVGHSILEKWHTYGMHLPLVAIQKVLEKIHKMPERKEE